MAAFDFMTPENQALLPSHLRSNAYMQAGGTAGGYAPWVENNINKTLAQTPYSTYDPRFFQGQNDFTNVYGGNPLDRSNNSAEMFNFNDPEEFRKRAQTPQVGQPQSNPIPGATPETTPGTTPATPGAATALGGGARSLANRKPGLAGGFSGWSGENQSGSNSNFNYFSRFA